MAELLVKAKPHWMDSFKKEDIDKLSEKKRPQYEARSQIGDVIVVKPDGWKWGNEECLPNYVVIKISGLSYQEAKKYEEMLFDGEKDGSVGKELKILKKRKYQIPKDIIDNAKQQAKHSISIEQNQKDNFIANILRKAK